MGKLLEKGSAKDDLHTMAEIQGMCLGTAYTGINGVLGFVEVAGLQKTQAGTGYKFNTIGGRMTPRVTTGGAQGDLEHNPCWAEGHAKVLYYLLPLIAGILVFHGAEHEAVTASTAQMSPEAPSLVAASFANTGLCMAFYESTFNVPAQSIEVDGNADYGIFQLSSQLWYTNNCSLLDNHCRMACRGTVAQERRQQPEPSCSA
ncbi:PREDICTED: uncharacterized protein LOC104537995 [Mesitornis unicolor]|uniref:uncharacterized protein LOC104537995 n=1 Tax=Mesitornis unicolor TaxID=54374 RepID=UPI000528A6C3|nr:PREDICTED: uncharacterized protein LOC104537995 [Mesitornis unicolor]